MQLSIVIPLYNEEESLPELAAWIHRVCSAQGFDYEVVMVDDGSTDRSWTVVEQLAAANPAIRGIRFRRNYGKSAALHEGFRATRGNVVITMDADLQDSPDEIPALYEMITRDGYDLGLTSAVSDAVDVPVIASGGAGSMEHLYDALAEGHASAVLAASIFHYEEHAIRHCKDYLQSRGIPVRP